MLRNASRPLWGPEVSRSIAEEDQQHPRRPM